MSKEDRSIYQTARLSKGLTQEKAAELLNISVESLRAYESERTPVSNDICAVMMDIYDASYLGIQHVRNNPTGSKIIPEFKVGMSVSVAILTLQKEMKDLLGMMDQLIEIGADGVIDDTEKIVYQKIIKETNELRTALLNIEFAKLS